MRSGFTSPRQARTSSTATRSSARPVLGERGLERGERRAEVRERARTSPGSGVQDVAQHLDRLRVAARGLEAAAEGGARLGRRARERDGLLEVREPVAGPHEQRSTSSRPSVVSQRGSSGSAARRGDLEQLRERLGVGRGALARVDAVEAGERRPRRA